jgi:hypothetical protein
VSADIRHELTHHQHDLAVGKELQGLAPDTEEQQKKPSLLLFPEAKKAATIGKPN